MANTDKEKLLKLFKRRIALEKDNRFLSRIEGAGALSINKFSRKQKAVHRDWLAVVDEMIILLRKNKIIGVRGGTRHWKNSFLTEVANG